MSHRSCLLAFCIVVLCSLPKNWVSGATNYGGIQKGRYLGPVQVETIIPGNEVFSEGPAVDADGRVYFTSIPAELILRWDPIARSLSSFRFPSNKANGLRFDPLGRLLACEGGAGRVTLTDLESKLVIVLADAFHNFPLAAPNDLDFDSKGRIYFSSRPGTSDPDEGNVNAVYRIDPNGRLQQVLHYPDVHMPNGLVVSPDEKTLFLIEAHPDADHHRDIRAYPILENGDLGSHRVVHDFYPGRSGDGMCIDAKGNLYVAAGLHKTRNTSETLDTRSGIHVVSPDGELLDYVETPADTITNCTFGGADLKTLYITCGSKLLSLRTTIPGKASYRPGQ
jgi:gluconolactonase